MHFKCIKCPNEFCSGCGQSIKRGQVSLNLVCVCVSLINYASLLGVWQAGVLQDKRSPLPPS